MDNEMNVNTETEVKEEVKTEEVATEDKSTSEKTFTQSEVDELIQKRIARETKKFEKKIAEAQKPTEEQISAEEEITNLKNLIASQNKQILNYEAGKIASTLNVRSDRMDAFLRLADLSEIELDDQGTYKDEIKEKIEALAAEYPEFIKVEEKKEKGGIKFGAETKQQNNEAEEALIRNAFGLK